MPEKHAGCKYKFEIRFRYALKFILPGQDDSLKTVNNNKPRPPVYFFQYLIFAANEP